MGKMRHTVACLILWKGEAGEKMKIAVVGNSGYIGSNLTVYFASKGYNILCFGREGEVNAHLDLRNVKNFSYVQLEDVDYVLLTAAISRPDKCADEFDMCWKVNVIGTGYFIEEALRRGCRVLFFSSDAVYASCPREIYDEDSIMEPKTPYGRMKQAIEKRFYGLQNFKTVRLSYVVSSEDKFISYLRVCREKNIPAEIFHPFYRNVIMLGEVLSSVAWILENWQEYKPPALCLAGDELVSRLRMVDEFNEMYDLQIGYRIVMPNEVFFKNRPRVTRMRSRYLYELGILPRKTFTERFWQQLRRNGK